MKKHFLRLMICLFACLAVPTGCSTDLFDYEEMNDRLDGLEERMTALENWCNETNTNINSLKTLVESLVIHDVITSVTPLVKDGKQIGYTITFMKSDPITIYHGNDGKDGATGAPGADGADGEDGKDGADGKDGMDG